ncbi:MAG: hypothetical protein AVDCRST_MAG54-1488, partial [uncultured Actinomycetospora sp.]
DHCRCCCPREGHRRPGVGDAALAAQRRDRRAGPLLLHRHRPGRALRLRRHLGRPRARARRAPLPRLPLPL